MPHDSMDDAFTEGASRFRQPVGLFPPKPGKYNIVARSVLENELLQPRHPEAVDAYIREEILESVIKKGHVYVLSAPQYFKGKGKKLVKIGKAVNVGDRISQIKSTCGISDLQRVFDDKDTPHHLYWKVERLVHAELENSREPLQCDLHRRQNGAPTEHGEWFHVPEQVALEVVQRWRDFVNEDPYDGNGVLKSHWSEMLMGT
ncbi:hypothetical protein AOQ84DRAFT_371258 [Glonium stellatum]|uniref:Bacteriophage T5 Orf172 DNA-binding domain-containing protein n=1 Tax=Glonium stellatum TaxID=574774 RepID=A0A8E2FCF4_9PEZI|nr:hypothetical protein AOQ84DRAFT_371258 [Glonium stellatum]